MTDKEKIIYEFRFFETEDGFRFEFKGDKDRLKNVGFEPGMRQNSWFGWRMSHFQKRHKRDQRQWHKRGRGFSPPWSWWWPQPETQWWDQEYEPKEGPDTPTDKA